MKMLINNGQVIDPALGFDEVSDVAIAAGRTVPLNGTAPDFSPNKNH
jgi:predicted amidohydrolase